jgi:hypothetical protein
METLTKLTKKASHDDVERIIKEVVENDIEFDWNLTLKELGVERDIITILDMMNIPYMEYSSGGAITDGGRKRLKRISEHYEDDKIKKLSELRYGKEFIALCKPTELMKIQHYEIEHKI